MANGQVTTNFFLVTDQGKTNKLFSQKERQRGKLK